MVATTFGVALEPVRVEELTDQFAELTIVLEAAEDVRRLGEALAAGPGKSGDVTGGAREVSVAGVRLRPGSHVKVPAATSLGPAPKPRPQTGRAASLRRTLLTGKMP